MKLIQRDDDGPTMAIAGTAGVAASAYVVATTNSTNYMHLPAVFGMVLGLWALVLAVVPVLRAKPGTPNRLLITVVSCAVVLVAGVLIGIATD